MDAPRSVTREELYEQVWSEPVIEVAKKYGISDVALRKRCIKLSIPLPPQGYWLRSRRLGKEDRPPLPPFKGNDTIEIKKSIKEPSPPPADPEQASEADAGIAFEKRPENLIHVLLTLSSPHPLVKHARSLLKNTKPSFANDEILRVWKDKCLDIRVSKGSVDRALRIMDALIKALDRRGYPLILNQPHSGRADYATFASVLGEDVEFYLKESLLKIERMPEESSKKSRFPILDAYPKHAYIPSSKLMLVIDNIPGEGLRVSWADGAKQKLEECLNDFIVGLLKASVAIRARRLKWQQAERERQEAERKRYEQEIRRQEEEARFQALLKESTNWHLSKQIREYIDAVRELVIKKHGDVQSGSEVEKWLEWAEKKADIIDPLKRTNG